MTRRKLLLPLAVLAMAGFGAFVLLATAPEVESVAPESALPIVRTMEARPADVRMRVRSQGTVAPRTESDLVPEVSGPVVWMSPSLVSGGFFAKDEPLLRLDPRDYEAALARARADVARASGEAEHAAAELRRQQGLARSKANSPSQLSNARRGERVAKAALEAARVSLEQAERDVARTEIVAPFDGRVREKHVDVGQFIGRGAPVATLYATDFAEIRLPLADRQLAYLELPGMRSASVEGEGPEVRLRANFAGVEQTWTGRIVRTEGEIDAKSRMVHVIARVEDPYDVIEQEEPSEESTRRTPLAVGMFVRAEIDGQIAENVIVVPRSAMRDGGHMLIVDDDNRLHRRAVEVLRIDRDEVLVRSELAGHERVVVSPIQVVVDGMRVRTIVDEAGTGS
jgi:RND family efflux transporter MFP subunit